MITKFAIILLIVIIYLIITYEPSLPKPPRPPKPPRLCFRDRWIVERGIAPFLCPICPMEGKTGREWCKGTTRYSKKEYKDIRGFLADFRRYKEENLIRSQELVGHIEEIEEGTSFS